MGVAAALELYTGECGALLFSLDHSACFAVHVEQVVGKAKPGVERKFAYGHTHAGVDVGVSHIADVPASRDEQRVNAAPGLLFWCHATCLLCHGILGDT